jgi:arylsulfatase A-like enzyme
MGANWHAAAGMTPHMDQLAAEGIRFTDFHVGASVCSVSRAALLTGRLGVRTGVVTNFAIDSVAGLPRTEKTITELLKPVGYRTAAVGKWHLGTTPGYHPTYRGFDKYVGIPYSVDMGCSATGGQDRGSSRKCGSGNLKPTPHQWQAALPLYHSESVNCSGQTAGSCNGDIIEAPVNFDTLSDTYSSFATEFIGNASSNASPFLLYVPFSHIHTPQYVATRNAGKSGKTGEAGHFYDTLLELDETVGKIMAALAADKAVDANTLTFLTGDNGPWETKCNLTGSAGPYTGLWQRTKGGGGSASKTTTWEGGHREVGVARWPGKIKPRVSNATISTLDFLPTFLALTGIPLPADRVFDGIDISAVLFQGSEQGHTSLFHPNSGMEGAVMGKLDGVRWKNWKAIYQTGGAADCEGNKGIIARHDPPLLFDLDRDPAESTALDTSTEPYQSVAATIAGLLKAQMHSVNTTMQSTVDYNVSLADEPCAHYPTSCRFDAPPPPPPPPPNPDHRKPVCNASAWYVDADPFIKEGLKPPFSKPVAASDAAGCCAACASPENNKLGCNYWVFMSGKCYLKQSVKLHWPPVAHPGLTSGSVHPWNTTTAV